MVKDEHDMYCIIQWKSYKNLQFMYDFWYFFTPAIVWLL